MMTVKSYTSVERLILCIYFCIVPVCVVCRYILKLAQHMKLNHVAVVVMFNLNK